jgi:hypothetical protein
LRRSRAASQFPAGAKDHSVVSPAAATGESVTPLSGIGDYQTLGGQRLHHALYFAHQLSLFHVVLLPESFGGFGGCAAL